MTTAAKVCNVMLAREGKREEEEDSLGLLGTWDLCADGNSYRRG